MGKGKGRGDEHACRVNYLFQAGEFVAGPAPQLSQYYGNVLTVVTEKTTPKKDFTMKRLMCKKCQSILKVGENATYRLRKNKRHKRTPNVILTCLFCGEVKRLPTRRNFRIKAEVSGRIVDSGTAGNGSGSGNNGNNSTTTTTGSTKTKDGCSSSSSTSVSTSTAAGVQKKEENSSSSDPSPSPEEKMEES